MDSATVVTENQQPQLNIPYIEGLLENLKAKIRNYLDRIIELEVINTLQGNQLGQFASVLQKNQVAFDAYKAEQEQKFGASSADLTQKSKDYSRELEQRNQRIQELEKDVRFRDHTILDLETSKNTLVSENENLKKVSSHVETFRKELVSEREKTTKLEEKLHIEGKKFEAQETMITSLEEANFNLGKQVEKALELLPKRKHDLILNLVTTKDGGEF